MEQFPENFEATTYEQHKKKARRNSLILLICLVVVVLVLGGVFFYVANLYHSTDVALILEHEDRFFADSGFLFPLEDDGVTPKNYVASYNLNTGDLYEYPVKEMDLAPFGLEGVFEYFHYQPNPVEGASAGRILSASRDDVALSRANTETLFVYRAPDEKKYLVDTAKNTATPLFAGGVTEGVDPYGTFITDFSHNGLYAFGFDGAELVIYVRQSNTSFAVQKVHRIDLSKKGVRFEASFTSESFLRIGCADEDGRYTYYMCSAKTGEMNPCERDADALFSEDARVASIYAQLYLPCKVSESQQPTDAFLLRYTEATVNKRFEHRLPADTNFATLLSASSRGEYAFIGLENDAESSALFSRTGSRQVPLSALYGPILQEGETLEKERVYFLANNIVLLNVSDTNGAYRSVIFKLCF